MVGSDILFIENKNIGNQAPFDFDVSVKDIFSAVFTGASVHLIPKMFFSFPQKLLDYLEEREISTIIWAVSALCLITTLNGFSYKIPSKIRKVMFSGEVMPVKHLRLWQQAIPEAEYVNLYGPTEITCNCLYYKVDRPFSDIEFLQLFQKIIRFRLEFLLQMNGFFCWTKTISLFQKLKSAESFA